MIKVIRKYITDNYLDWEVSKTYKNIEIRTPLLYSIFITKNLKYLNLEYQGTVINSLHLYNGKIVFNDFIDILNFIEDDSNGLTESTNVKKAIKILKENNYIVKDRFENNDEDVIEKQLLKVI